MDILLILQYGIMPLLALSLLMVMVRFLIGPSFADRVAALDLLITIGIAMMAVYAILTHQESFLDIAMIFALIAFLGTIAFSYYIENKKDDE